MLLYLLKADGTVIGWEGGVCPRHSQLLVVPWNLFILLTPELLNLHLQEIRKSLWNEAWSWNVICYSITLLHIQHGSKYSLRIERGSRASEKQGSGTRDMLTFENRIIVDHRHKVSFLLFVWRSLNLKIPRHSFEGLFYVNWSEQSSVGCFTFPLPKTHLWHLRSHCLLSPV